MGRLLAGTLYDPATAVSKATTAALAMTAIDTTNLRLTFTVPTSGKVLIRLQGTLHGAATFPRIHLGVMNTSGTVRGRMTPGVVAAGSLAASVEVLFSVSSLTPGSAGEWDAAYGVESPVASTGLKYGGANDATADNSGFGGFVFEIWAA